MDELYVLYFGNDQPVAERIRQLLIENLEGPVTVRQTPTAPEPCCLPVFGNPGIIISDDEKSLSAILTACPDVPVICLIDAFEDKTAAHLIENGAADCVPRDTLDHLPFAVFRELKRKKRFPCGGQSRIQKNAMILNALSEGVALFDRKGTILNVNRHFAQRFGMTSEQIVGLNWQHLFPDEKYRSFLKNRLKKIRLTYDTKKPMKFVDERDGRWYHSRIYPVIEGDRVTSVAVISSDITDHVHLDSEKVRNAVLEKEAKMLREKERALLDILDGAADGSCIVDCRNRTVRLSESWLKRTGCWDLPGAELLSVFESRIHPEDRKRSIGEQITAVSQRRPRLDMEFRFKLPDGRYQWTLLRGKIIYDENGEAIKYYGALNDISERKKSEDALLESEEKFRIMIEMAGEGIVITKPDGTCTYVNQHMADMLGYAIDEFVGKTCFDQSIMDCHDEIKRVLSELTIGNVIHNEFRLRKKDGTEVWTHYNASPLFDEFGVHIANFAMFTDISEKKKAAAELRASEQRALALVAELEKTKYDLLEEIEALRRLHLISSVHLMLNDLSYIYNEILDAAIEITHAAKGCLQIFDEQENCLRITAHYAFSEALLARFSVIYSGSKTSGAALQNKTRSITHNTEDPLLFTEDEIILLREENIRCIQSTPMISCTGKFYGILSTHYSEKHRFSERELRLLDLLTRLAADFIERKQNDMALEISEKNAKSLVETLQKIDRNKDEFLKHLSHELRNPLATINAAISLIDITSDLSLIRETTNVVKNEAKQLNRLINDLLDVTRITTNKLILRKKMINLSETVATSAMNFGPQFALKSIRFNADINDTPILLNADPARITQIIENLLVNALTFTDEGGTVTLTLRKNAKNAIIRIEDNGIGVSPEELPLLFNSFYQAEKPSTRVDSGLGLGLSIVKSIAELHHGKVSAYSKGLGSGSTFTVSLPLDVMPPEQAAAVANSHG